MRKIRCRRLIIELRKYIYSDQTLMISFFVLFLLRYRKMISNKTINNNENDFNLSARILMAVSLVCICILGIIGKLFK